MAKYEPPVSIPWDEAPKATATKAGVVKMAEFVADPAGDAPTAAEFEALRDALVDAGIMAEKAE